MKIKDFLKSTKWKIIFAIVPSIMYVLAGSLYSYLVSLSMNGVNESLLYPIVLILEFFILLSSNFAQILTILSGIILRPFGLFSIPGLFYIVGLITFIFLFFVWYIIACFISLIYEKFRKVKKK